MNNKPLAILLVLAVIVLGYFIFASEGEDIPVFTGASLDMAEGEVIEVDTKKRFLMIERDSGDRVKIISDDRTETYNLYNRNVNFRNISVGSLIRADDLIREGQFMVASKVNVLDTNSDYEITSYDVGKTFTYNKDVEFSVILNDNQYPFGSLRCNPEGVVSNVSDSPGANPPYYRAKFEVVGEGECDLVNNDFSVTIVVE